MALECTQRQTYRTVLIKIFGNGTHGTRMALASPRTTLAVGEFPTEAACWSNISPS
jgi:hypothetical protein